MTTEEKVKYLTDCYPDFAKRTIRDKDARGNVFFDLIMENRHNPSYPLTVNVREDGCVISVGPIENVTGGKPISHETAVSAIADIIEDRVVFVTAFGKKETYGVDTPSFTQIFALTGREDDMKQEYDMFIEKISKPISKFGRIFTSLKGRFIITNFSGSVSLEINR